MQAALLFSTFFLGVCGLVYELITSTLASYLLGDSVTQFSTVIGVYLFSMGIGSWLSKYIVHNLIGVFIQVEILVGVVGGASAALLFIMFDHVEGFRFLLYGLIGLIGVLVGLELPLVMRILRSKFPFKDLVAKVFTFDYIGALIASILFPLLLVPKFGLIRTCFFFGMVNVAVALWALSLFRREVPWVRSLRLAAVVALIGLGFGFALSERIMTVSEEGLFQEDVVFARTSPYQRLVLTRSAKDLRLFINGNLQFSSRDEYRYHEALVHVGLASVDQRANVLILGGGDGMAAREVLKYQDVARVTLVDLDPLMTHIFSTHAPLVALNQSSLQSPKLTVVNADAFEWLKHSQESFDFVVVDFPDPSSFSLGKLYSSVFYQTLGKHLAAGGAFVVQSTSPVAARRSYWCVVNTVAAAGFSTIPYHTYVPSFGEWGFVIGSTTPLALKPNYPDGMRYLSAETLPTLTTFPKDMARIDTEINRLNNQALVRYFDEEWTEYLR